MLLWFAYLLLGIKGTIYDNFSHWMLVVREILKNDRMPTFANELITYTAYPLGSVLWIYYVCKVVGLGESFYLFANQIMALSLLLPVVVWMTHKKWMNFILVVGYALYALTANTVITDLLVDSMLATAAVALFAMGSYYEKDLKRAILCAMPMLVFLIQLKNSGIFFAIFYLLYFGLLHRQDLLPDCSMGKRFLGWNVLLPLGSLLIWQKHVKLVFADGMLSTHAMSLEKYLDTIEARSLKYIGGLFSSVFAEGMSFRSSAFILLLVFTIVLAFFYAVSSGEHLKSKTLTQIVVNWGVYILYLVGMGAMYAFSMQTSEADRLAGFERYVNTCGAFIYGMTAIFLMQNMEGLTKSWCAAALSTAICIGVCWNISALNLETLTKRMDWKGTQRGEVQACIRNVEKGCRYVVYNTNEDRWYQYHLLIYELEPHGREDVEMRNSFSNIADIKMLRNQADYLFIWTPDEISDAFLRENGLEEFCGEKGAAIDLRYMTK